MAIKSIVRSPTNPGANVGTKEASPIYVDSDDNILKIIPAESGSTEVQILTTPSTLTQGSVLFAGASGSISQDNANFFWDDTNNTLGIGTTAPNVEYQLTVFAPASAPAGGVLISSGRSANTQSIGNFAWIALNSVAAQAFYTYINGKIISNTSTLETGRLEFHVTTVGVDTQTFVLEGKNAGIGTGTSTPTARLQIGAGTATASTAPLKFTSGTNLTTAEAGAMEYNGTNLFFTRAGTTREGVLTQSAVTTEAIVSDTSVTVNIGGVTYRLLARA